MGYKEEVFFYKGKKIKIRSKVLSNVGMFRGLMFRDKNFKECLLFDFYKLKGKYRYAIHSYFVFFDFLAVWIDDKNKVCEVVKVKPFTFQVKPKYPIYRLLEVPFHKDNKKILEFFVGKRKI